MSEQFERCITLATNANEPITQALDLFYALCKEIYDFTSYNEYHDYLNILTLLLMNEHNRYRKAGNRDDR